MFVAWLVPTSPCVLLLRNAPSCFGFFFSRSGCSFSLLADLLDAWLSACCLGAHLFKWLNDAVENLLVGTFAVQTVTYHLNLRHVANGGESKASFILRMPNFHHFHFFVFWNQNGEVAALAERRAIMAGNTGNVCNATWAGSNRLSLAIVCIDTKNRRKVHPQSD